MEKYYNEYWAQTWYRNSFLVRCPKQIAQAIGHDHEWNNLYDSGCHFTCLSMIIGVDPARLSSTMASMPYFVADRAIPARFLNGRTGGLVWDQNEPHYRIKEVVLDNFWHSKLGRRVNIKIRFLGIIETAEYSKGKQLIKTARKKGQHIICGTQEHSYLVAGNNEGDFFIWDPDDSEIPIEEILNGKLTLCDLFDKHKGEKIEFWKYQVDYFPAVSFRRG